MPDSKILLRILFIISKCKTAAHCFTQFLITTNFKPVKKWIISYEKSPTEKRIILEIIQAVISIGSLDYNGPSQISE